MTEARRVPHSRPLIERDEIEAAERVLRSGHLAQGPEVEAFEDECAAFLGRTHAVAVNSGTAALHLALEALELRGKTVAIPSYACSALLTAIAHAGATAVLSDIDDAYNLDTDTLPGETSASIVTHLFGKTGPIPGDGVVIEDLAQGLGGSAGREGAVAVASFYATKLLTSGGEGGMIITDDSGLADYARERRDYDNRDHFQVRYNYKMTDLAATIGRQQLKKLPGWIARRREMAAEYSEAFRELPLELPDPADHVFFRYVVATDQRAALEVHLARLGVEAKRPVHRPAHRYFPAAAETMRAVVLAEYPKSEAAHQSALSIPLNPAMSDADKKHVVQSVRQFF